MDGTSLFHIKGFDPLDTRAVQVEESARTCVTITMVLAVGESIPDVTVHYEFPPQDVSLKARLAGKKTIVVGLPGAFTPT